MSSIEALKKRLRPAVVYQSLEAHPKFHKIAPYMSVEVYGREKNRLRFGLQGAAPYQIRAMALALTIQCCACENVIHPFRERKAEKKRGDMKRGVYVSVSCPDDVKRGCSKGNASKWAIERLELGLRRRLEELEE